jgi:hypothetical protein
MPPPKRLPRQVYETNPPNCIYVLDLDCSIQIGPGIRTRRGYLRFHDGFRRTRCRTLLGLKQAITRWCNKLGMDPLSSVYFDTPKKK